jgi:hypothetical protein
VHPSTRECDTLDQKRTMHASWHAIASEVCWEISADTSGARLFMVLMLYLVYLCSVAFLRNAFTPILDKLSCSECQTLTRERIRKLVVDWAMIRSTI